MNKATVGIIFALCCCVGLVVITALINEWCAYVRKQRHQWEEK